jgi:Predicted integral membrane protein (DUF2269)
VYSRWGVRYGCDAHVPVEPKEARVRQAMLFLHILAGFALAAGNAAALAATVTARRASLPNTVLALMVLHRRSVQILVIPGAVLVLLSGLYLTDAIGVGFGAPWIAGSLAAWGLALLLGIVVLVPAQTRAITTARQLVAGGAAQPSPTLRQHVGAWHVVAAEWAQQALIVGFLALMVFRPT